jgi:hypothetical protein
METKLSVISRGKGLCLITNILDGKIVDFTLESIQPFPNTQFYCDLVLNFLVTPSKLFLRHLVFWVFSIEDILYRNIVLNFFFAFV